MFCILTEHLDEGSDPLVTKASVLVEEDVGAGLGIIKGIVMVVEVDVEGVANRVELVVGQSRQELATAADGVEGLVGRGLNPVVFQGTLEDAVIKAVVVGDHQLVWGVEGLNVLPDRWKIGGILNVVFVDPVNLDVAPEEVSMRVDKRVKFVGDLAITNDGQGQ